MSHFLFPHLDVSGFLFCLEVCGEHEFKRFSKYFSEYTTQVFSSFYMCHMYNLMRPPLVDMDVKHHHSELGNQSTHKLAFTASVCLYLLT